MRTFLVLAVCLGVVCGCVTTRTGADGSVEEIRPAIEGMAELLTTASVVAPTLVPLIEGAIARYQDSASAREMAEASARIERWRILIDAMSELAPSASM